MIMALVNVLYLLSLGYTYFFNPAGPIFEEDKIVGMTDGLTWFDIGMLLPFNFIHYSTAQ